MYLYISQSTEIHTSVNTVAYHSIRKRIHQSTFYTLQSTVTIPQTSYSAVSSETGISFGSQYDLFRIIYWIENKDNLLKYGYVHSGVINSSSYPMIKREGSGGIEIFQSPISRNKY